MAQKCTVLGMLLTIHSLGLIFASLFTHKWYVDNTKDVGVFGICQYKIIYFNDTNSLVGNSGRFFECFQLLWPDTVKAEQYLAANSVYLTGMMGVAIASTALGFLTLAWALFSILVPRIGYHPRSCDLLLALSILTDMSILTTIGMFLGKDNKLYPFENYGVSFWCSVGSAGGFLLISIIYALNRINSGFTYTMKYYDSDISGS